MKNIESVSTILNDMLKHNLRLLPQKSLTKIQDEVPDKYILLCI